MKLLTLLLLVSVLFTGTDVVRADVYGEFLYEFPAPDTLRVAMCLRSINDFGQPIISLEINSEYDVDSLKLIDIDYDGSILESWGMIAEDVDSSWGHIKVAVASAYELDADEGRLLTITFVYMNGTTAASISDSTPALRVDSTWLRINETVLNPPLSVDNDSYELPETFQLAQNFPNPFNPTTTISFSLARSSAVRLAVYNVLGREVKVLAQGTLEAGRHEVVWDGTDHRGRSVASGVYCYRLETIEYIDAKKMILLK